MDLDYLVSNSVFMIVLLAAILILLIAALLMSSSLRKLKRNVDSMAFHNQALGQKIENTEKEIAGINHDLDEIKRSNFEMMRAMQESLKNFGEIISGNQKNFSENIDKRLFDMSNRMSATSLENEQKLENIRQMMEKKVTELTEENNKQLEKMRETVDEKLQKTLEDRISKSFATVSERLEQVYKGLGEMQTLANGVGDLKKVLSNVKTRGTLGEVQLGAILSQILAKEQYEENIATVPGSSERVEFAVKLPGEKDNSVYLPIDSKFPGDTYAQLRDAYETGNKVEIDKAWKTLEQTIKNEAKDIHGKYVFPPYTTDFAIMFLPFEGLYSEVVNHGMLEVLQRDYKVNIAGPTTMAALLNSLQMGFKTLAIQKHSSEVWDILGAVKTEFANFSKALEMTRTRLRQADDELDKLVGVRTRAIEKKLRSVESLDSGEAQNLLDI